MSFLDNLESSLKSLESRDERGPEDHKRRDIERARTLAVAPWAEKLKQSQYAKELLGEATRAGHKLRAKVYIAWIGTTLRLDLREHRLELRPSADEVNAVFLEKGAELKRQPVDLESSPAELVEEWLVRVVPALSLTDSESL